MEREYKVTVIFNLNKGRFTEFPDLFKHEAVEEFFIKQHRDEYYGGLNKGFGVYKIRGYVTESKLRCWVHELNALAEKLQVQHIFLIDPA